MAKKSASDNALTAHTVLRRLTLPHCWEMEHEHFSNPDETGTKEPVSLGLRPCDLEDGVYLPGQMVHLPSEQAQLLVTAGMIAPAGSEDVEQLLVKAAGKAAASYRDLVAPASTAE